MPRRPPYDERVKHWLTSQADGTMEGTVKSAAPPGAPGTRGTKISPSPSGDNFIIGVGVHTITVGTTAPSSPKIGDLWVDTT